MLRSFRIALAFLTTLPVGSPNDWEADDMRRSVRAYPLVGLVLGLLLTLAFLLLEGAPDLLRAVLLVALWLGLTGALHFDGFVDMADAALASAPPRERQRIAKDVSVGAFALAAGSLLLLVKVAALASLEQAAVLLAALVLSRSAVPLVMAAFPVSGSSRLGRLSRVRSGEMLAPVLGGLLLAALCTLPSLSARDFFLLSAAGLGSSLLLAAWLNGRMAGLSGDAYGAVVETTEAIMLCVAVLL